MKRQIFLLTINLLVFSQAFSQADFRNVSWGMTIDEVKAKETSVISRQEKNLVAYKDGKEYYDGINLIYENVKIKDKVAKLLYRFDNGILTKIEIEFVPNPQAYYPEKVSELIKYRFSDIWNSLLDKDMTISYPLMCGRHPYDGPDHTDKSNSVLFHDMTWGINDSNLELIQKMVDFNKHKAVFARFEGKRTNGILTFRTIHNEWRNKQGVASIELSPSRILEQQLKSNDF